jgi:F-box and WD-40 domain protein CDC4
MAVKGVFGPLHAEEERNLEGHTQSVRCLLVHGDNLISGGSHDYSIKVWNTDTWACENTLEGHTKVVFCMVVHGCSLVSGSGDQKIKAWGTR